MITELEEAIENEKAIVDNMKEAANEWLRDGWQVGFTNLTPEREAEFKANREKEAKSCLECAEIHEQVLNWLTELAERREADRWIPIETEKDLPKESGFYLVTMEYRDSVSYKLRRVTTELFFSTIFQKWTECDSEDAEDGVIAWKPKPEPYTESEDK